MKLPRRVFEDFLVRPGQGENWLVADGGRCYGRESTIERLREYRQCALCSRWCKRAQAFDPHFTVVGFASKAQAQSSSTSLNGDDMLSDTAEAAHAFNVVLPWPFDPPALNSLQWEQAERFLQRCEATGISVLYAEFVDCFALLSY